MRPPAILWFALTFVLLTPRDGFAQGPLAPGFIIDESVLEVAVVGDERIESDPGTSITVAFSVRNRHNEPRLFRSLLNLPDAWSVVTSGDEFEIGADKHALRLINLRIPEGYPPGRYTVSFTAFSTDGLVEDSADLVVEVRTYRGLSVSVSDAPRLASASRPHKIEFLVRNLGNTSASVHLELESTPFSAEMEQEVITITSNGQYQMSVLVKPNPDLLMQARSRVRLRARHDEDVNVKTSAEAMVAVIPDGASVHSLRPRVEMSARVTSTGSGDQVGVQSEVIGRIPLSGDNEHQAEVWLRTPSTTRTPLSQSDTYALRYTGPQFWAKLGDHVFDVSPLTSVSRFGTGVGGGVSVGRFSARTHYRGARHDLESDREVGASVSLDLREAGTTSINALSGTGRNRGYAGSLRYEVTPAEAIALDVEGGFSGREAAEFMYSVGARGRLSETAYYMRASHRGTEHPGQIYGYTSQLAGLSSLVREDLSVAFTISNEVTASRLSDEPVRHRRFINGAVSGVSRHRNFIASARLELRGESLERLTQTGTFSSRLAQIKLRGGIAVRHVRFTSNIDVGRLYSEEGRRGVSSRVEFESSWSKDSHQIQASVFRESGPSVERLQSSAHMGFRLSGSEQLTGQLKVRANLMGSRTTTSGNMFIGTGWLGLEYQFADGKRITAETQLVMQRGAHPITQANYRLSLEIPLSANNPIPMRGSLLEGIVVDEDTGEGIPDVLLIIGDQSTLTAEDGRFALRRPPAGIYHLMIDRVTLGLESVPTIPMPMLIDVPADGSTSFIRIPVTSRTDLRGAVELFDIRGGAGSIAADTVAVGSAEQAVIEISSGDIRHRRVTDRDGLFSFSDLPPGHWTVHVVEQSLPVGYYPEKETYEVHLPLRESFRIRLLSESRPLQLLDGGALEIQ